MATEPTDGLAAQNNDPLAPTPLTSAPPKSGGTVSATENINPLSAPAGSGSAETQHGKHGKSKNKEPHYELPDAQTLKEAGELKIKDEYGKAIPFNQLYASKAGQHLIVFIRHFFCGHCEDYIRALSTELPPPVLHRTTPVTHLTVIGCGDIAPIPEYRTRTMHSLLGLDTFYSIYCDPTRALYSKLGMLSNMDKAFNTDGEKPDYVEGKSEGILGAISTVASSLKNVVLSGPTTALQGGNVSQNGGEMLFANGECVWFKRMRHTQDHSEVAELKEILGLE